MKKIDTQSWKADLPAFREKTAAFYAGELSKNDYKGFSGLYGSYAQKGGNASMLRLRMTAGTVTKEKLAYVAQAVKKYGVKKIHFTTCQSIQLHDLDGDTVCNIMEGALDAGIVTMGGGGDFPRNVMCSPLSGVEKEEYFDVRPYANEAAEYLMHFIKAEKMPRKLKVCFSNSPANAPHATFRDLGFVATAQGTFDVYSAGGLGNNPMLGVKVAENVAPDMICYYIRAMWQTFRKYGNYENRGKARTRYMQETLGGPEGYRKAYQQELEQVFASGEDLKLHVVPSEVTKKGDGVLEAGKDVIEQKQEGLYTVIWHPIGGMPDSEVFCAVADAILPMESVQMHLAPDESAYIVNLTGEEAKKVLELIKDDTARSLFETSVSCIGATVCQIGLRDSQGLLRSCVKAVKEAGIADGALPQIHISGCTSSCGTHQAGVLGLRGGSKKVEGLAKTAFVLYVNGQSRQGKEKLGQELGAIEAEQIPLFLVELGKMVMAENTSFADWYAKNPEGLEKLAEKYTS